MKTKLKFAYRASLGVSSIILILSLTCTFTFGQIKIWDKRYGGSEFDQLSYSIATDDGGYLLGGYSTSNISGDKTQASRGDLDFWIIKLNGKGNKVWDKRYGGKLEDVLACIVPTADGGYLLGGWSNSPRGGDKTQSPRGWDDYWIVRIDALGNKLWDRRYGGNLKDHLLSMAPTGDGGFILAGSSYSDASGDKTQPSRGNDDYWVVRIDSDGNQLWDQRYGGNESDLPTEIYATPDKGFLLAGRSSSKEGGDKTEGQRGDSDYWLVKINRDGHKLWDRTFGGDMFDMPSKICATLDEGFLIGGSSDSNVSGDVTQAPRGFGWDDMWIVKIDGDGNKIWDRHFGGDHADGLQDIEPTPDGNFLLGGWSYSNISGEKTEFQWGSGDFWTVKIDPDGHYLWDKRYGGDQYDAIFDIVPMPDGNFLLTGASQSDISGDKTQLSRGDYDFWLIKFNPNPAFTFRPIDISLICDPFCRILRLDIKSRHLKAVTAFSFRIKLPRGKATFNTSGHTFNPELQSDVAFKIEDDNTMLVTWKNPKAISLKNETNLVNASIKIQDASEEIEICVTDPQAFNADGQLIEAVALCGNIDFRSTNGPRASHENNLSSFVEDRTISISPNPTNGIVQIEFPHASKYELVVYDVHGKILTSKNVSTREAENVKSFDFQHLAEGLYLIKVRDGNRTFTEKMIVDR